MIIIPTVDVEGVYGPRPLQQLILGEVGERETWGAFRQARIFQRFGIRATFFVDVFEYTLWGKSEMERVCQTLAELGQDVQLHTHPAWRDDRRDEPWLREHKRRNSYLSPERDVMAKLTYYEQVSVLQEGIYLLEQWLGKKPIAHRSGGYSINQDTVAALSATGFKIDSSMNASHLSSELVWSKNRVVEREGIIEIPVTLMRYVMGPARMLRGLSPIWMTVKTDLDWCSADDLLAFLRVGEMVSLKVMNFFMHSFSLLERDPMLRRIRPSHKRLKRLERFLERASENTSVTFMDCSSFLQHYQRSPASFDGPDVIPDITSPRTMLSLGARMARYSISYQLHGHVHKMRRRSAERATR